MKMAAMSILVFQSSVNSHCTAASYFGFKSLMCEYSSNFLCYLVVASFILVTKTPICDYALLLFPLCVTCLWKVNVL